jgi:hypothetical protein
VSLAGRPVWTPREGAALAREGFQHNPVVHRAVRMIAEAAAGLPLLAFVGRREVPDHPVLRLLARPNPREGGAAFLEALYGHLLLAGNAYVEQVPGADGRPAELHGLRPDRMAVVPGPDGWPAAYDYTVGGRTLRFDQEQGGVPPVLHLRLFHPLDDHYGLAPAAAAAAALDIHNAAGFWNKALLDNAARPSGALVYAGPPGVDLTDAQFERLRAELEASFQGAANAGRPLLLEGGLDWKPLSLSPKEMDFVEAKAAAARDIALAFGVPPMLLGLPGDNTYANYAEANRSFWRQTVIPLATRTAQALAGWLGPAWPEAGGSSGVSRAFSDVDGLRLEPDLDRIEALSTEREALWSRVGAAGFLTDDEKREAVGYGPRPGTKAVPPVGSFTVTPSPQGEEGGDGEGSGSGGEPWRNQPRVPSGKPAGGQWTDGAGGAGGEPAQRDLVSHLGRLAPQFAADLRTLVAGTASSAWTDTFRETITALRLEPVSIIEDLEELGGGKPRYVRTPKGADQWVFPNGAVVRFDRQPGQYLRGQRPHINLENSPGQKRKIHIGM